MKAANEVNKETPFFIGHGDADQVCRYEWGKETARVIGKDLGHQVIFKTYPDLPHSASLQEIDDLEEWITKCLNAKTGSTGEAGEGSKASM